MSVRRSPPGTPSGVGDPQVLVLPELRAEAGAQQVTLRKRKKPDDGSNLIHDFADFREEMLSIFQDFTKSQNRNLSKIANDIASIKEQIQSIEEKTNNILLEQNKLKTDIAELNKRYNSAENKIVSLENNIKQIKADSINKSDLVFHCEDVLTEMRERNFREKNIIITGIPELKSSITEERLKHDINKVTMLIKSAKVENTCPVHCIRLGKYRPNYSRPIKAIFTSYDQVKNILKNRRCTEGNVKIYSDNTPQQQKYLNTVKEELELRKGRGENNIIIKYIKGVPKIVEQQPKN